MLGKGFFLTESHNLDLPPENYNQLVYEKTTSGNYSKSLSWGKYKIIFSGAGGGGAAGARERDTSKKYANSGLKGEEKTFYLNVYSNTTTLISGIIGAGGSGGYAKADDVIGTGTGGAGGSGYINGQNGTTKYQTVIPYQDSNWAISGGGGGGASNVSWDNNIQIAAGGNGGGAEYLGIFAYGGTGGNGGANGVGAAGGNGVFIQEGQVLAGSGSSGYIRVYKSNLKPEPI